MCDYNYKCKEYGKFPFSGSMFCGKHLPKVIEWSMKTLATIAKLKPVI